MSISTAIALSILLALSPVITTASSQQHYAALASSLNSKLQHGFANEESPPLSSSALALNEEIKKLRGVVASNLNRRMSQLTLNNLQVANSTISQIRDLQVKLASEILNQRRSVKLDARGRTLVNSALQILKSNVGQSPSIEDYISIMRGLNKVVGSTKRTTGVIEANLFFSPEEQLTLFVREGALNKQVIRRLIRNGQLKNMPAYDYAYQTWAKNPQISADDKSWSPPIHSSAFISTTAEIADAQIPDYLAGVILGVLDISTVPGLSQYRKVNFSESTKVIVIGTSSGSPFAALGFPDWARDAVGRKDGP
jgi:hypothetical protein